VARSWVRRAKGRRVRKTVGSTVTEYFYLGATVIAEKKGETWTDYIFFGGQRIAQNTGSTLSTTRFLHPNHLGSTRVCADGSGDSAGTCYYEPFGEFRAGTTCSVPTVYRFAGMEWDGEIGGHGLYHTWFRQYDATQGRWMGIDPLAGSADDSQLLDRYAYVGNDPVNFTDQFGLYPSWIMGILLFHAGTHGLDIFWNCVSEIREVGSGDERDLKPTGRRICSPEFFWIRLPMPDGTPGTAQQEQPPPPVHPQTPCDIGRGRRFGPGHRAIDVQTPAGHGSPIYAPERGRIVTAYGSGWPVPRPYDLTQPPPPGATNYFTFRTDSGYTVSYWHAHAVLPQPARIPRGALVGLTDDTGRQTAPHVHVTVRNPQGQLIDPITYFTACQ
jgi:RHS repeat-associated protein